jgi:hypothetical protein
MEVQGSCPYCGELIALWIDESAGRSQHYVEDCAVCCRPIEVHASTDEDGEPYLSLQRDDD